MVLSNTEIREEIDSGRLLVEPMRDEQVQPSSIDLTLGDEFIVYGTKGLKETIDPRDPDTIERLGTTYEGVNSLTVRPDQFVLATTEERIDLPDDIMGKVEGVSSVGRLGPIPHTAGVIDPGWDGDVTLEIKNHNPHPVTVYPGMRFCQLVLHRCGEPANPAYGEKEGAKYQGQKGVTESRYHQEVSADGTDQE